MKRASLLVAVMVAFLMGWCARGQTGTVSAGSSPPNTPYAQFVGGWPHLHGNGLLTVEPNGHGSDHFRTFVACDGSVHLTACDKTIGKTVYPGGYITFTLNKVYKNEAFGSIKNASSSWEVDTRVLLVLGSNDVLTIQDAAGSTPTCGIRARNLSLGGCRSGG